VLRRVPWKQTFSLGEPEESTQRSDFQVETLPAESTLRACLSVFQRPVSLVLQKLHQVGQRDSFPIYQSLFSRPGNELGQQRGVGALRVLRLASLVPEMLQKVLNQVLHSVSGGFIWSNSASRYSGLPVSLS